MAGNHLLDLPRHTSHGRERTDECTTLWALCAALRRQCMRLRGRLGTAGRRERPGADDHAPLDGRHARRPFRRDARRHAATAEPGRRPQWRRGGAKYTGRHRLAAESTPQPRARAGAPLDRPAASPPAESGRNAGHGTRAGHAPERQPAAWGARQQPLGQRPGVARVDSTGRRFHQHRAPRRARCRITDTGQRGSRPIAALLSRATQ